MMSLCVSKALALYFISLIDIDLTDSDVNHCFNGMTQSLLYILI